MSDPLATYLNDHLAASNFAIEVFEFLRDHHSGDVVGASAGKLLQQVTEDRRTLESIIERTGSGRTVLKEAAAWVSEKISQLKLRRGGFGTFEALETLSIGILGKLALWRALETISQADERLRGVDYERLVRRAQAQHSELEQLRLEAAHKAFAPVAQ